MNAKEYRLGLLPDPPDERDFKYTVAAPSKLPTKAILPAPEPEDQKRTNACTAFALCGIVQASFFKAYGIKINLSELYQYYNSRFLDGDTSVDKGSTLRTALKAYNRFGACLDELWTFAESKVFDKPTEECYKDGAKRYRLKYSRISTLDEVRDSLSCGNYVYGGIKIYESFYLASEDGMVPTPKGNLKGYHAIVVHGYDDKSRLLHSTNSWGKDWGDKGKFYIPYNLFESLFIDLWSVELTALPITGVSA